MNPILPLKQYVPDAEARRMPDGRMYLYGSYDRNGGNNWCSDVLHVFSSDNLIDWIDHGIAFRSVDVPWGSDRMLYAPDCIHKDGKYYLYFCMQGGYEGMAVSDTPYGPFKNPVPIKIANQDGIDPAIFIDDDGQAYYYWGQFSLRAAKMNEDMCTLDESSINYCLIDEKRHGFHEGSSMRKRNGLYYLLYTDISRGKATCISYAIGKTPLGPFVKGGVIIDNINCDPNTWNNHGSMEMFHDQWYIFYHRSSQNAQYNRRMCIEPIYFDDEGAIKEVCMTSQGCEPCLPQGKQISARNACKVLNGFYITLSEKEDCEILSHGKDQSVAVFKYFQLDNPKEIIITAACCDTSADIFVWTEDGVIGKCCLSATGGWEQFREFHGQLRPVHGLQTIYLVVSGDRNKIRLAQIKSIEFVS